MAHSFIVCNCFFLWKHQCEVTFNGIPPLFTLGELRIFKKQLAFLPQVNLDSFFHDVESLPMGASGHFLTILAYVDQDFPSTLFCVV
jgi:hypothetical protein